MPIWLRNYTFKKIKDWYDSASSKDTNSDSWVNGQTKEIAAQNKKIQVPTYVTKAAKK